VNTQNPKSAEEARKSWNLTPRGFEKGRSKTVTRTTPPAFLSRLRKAKCQEKKKEDEPPESGRPAVGKRSD